MDRTKGRILRKLEGKGEKIKEKIMIGVSKKGRERKKFKKIKNAVAKK